MEYRAPRRIFPLWRRADRLFINDGTGKFTDQTQGNFITTPGSTLDIAVGDLDNDGDEDLFMTHLVGETNTVYLNDGQGLFSDRSRAAGRTSRW